MKEAKMMRVTIMLETEIAKVLRVEQSRRLQKTNKSVSFSTVINDELRKHLGLKKPRKGGKK